jgi:hypothetical protein
MSYQGGNLQLSGKRLDLLREAWENTPVKLHLEIVTMTSDRWPVSLFFALAARILS